MMTRHIARLSSLCLTLLLAACSLQLPLSPEQQHQAATIVAGTLEALGTPMGPYEKPMLTITGNSNCREGPGASYKIITSFTPGTSLELVGRNAANNFWQVKMPNSEETCWVWGQYAQPSGSYENLPESAPAPAAASGAPARPGSLFYQYTCPGGALTTNLTWSDAANNEAGYHVYRFDLLIADLPANSTSYTDVVSVAPYSDLQYSVEAYNSAGASPSRTVNFSCE